MAHEIKRNDLRPRYRMTLLEPDPAQPVGSGIMRVVDLTSASSVRFYMKSQSGTIKVNQPAAFVDRVNGVVEYAWTGIDTDTSGPYNIEFEVNWDGANDKQTFPSSGYFTTTIFDDLV